MSLLISVLTPVKCLESGNSGLISGVLALSLVAHCMQHGKRMGSAESRHSIQLDYLKGLQLYLKN